MFYRAFIWFERLSLFYTVMDILQWCLLYFTSSLPDFSDNTPEHCSIARECSWWNVCLPSSLNVCEQISVFPWSTSLGLWHLLCQCLFLPNYVFSKGRTPHLCVSVKLIHFFMWQLLTELVIQQKWWNKMMVTYGAFKLWTEEHPQSHNIKG